MSEKKDILDLYLEEKKCSVCGRMFKGFVDNVDKEWHFCSFNCLFKFLEIDFEEKEVEGEG